PDGDSLAVPDRQASVVAPEQAVALRIVELRRWWHRRRGDPLHAKVGEQQAVIGTRDADVRERRRLVVAIRPIVVADRQLAAIAECEPLPPLIGSPLVV